MGFDLQKSHRTRWQIKKKNLEPLSITSTEFDDKLHSIKLSQAESEMTYAEFLEYYDYISKIKNKISDRFIQDNPYTTIEPIEDPIVKKSNENKPKTGFPLTIPSKLEIPEIFILTKNGLCLFHFEFFGEIKEKPINQNLISGLLSAINTFAVNMGWEKGLNLIRSGDSELRFGMGEHIIVALSSNVNMKLSYLVEQILVDLANDLGRDFEHKYHQYLEKSNENGIADTAIFTDFKETVNTFFIKYRKQTFELYQKLILTEGIYLGCLPELCANLIHRLTNGKSVIGEMSEILRDYPIISHAISKVNIEQKPLWQIFNIPLFKEY